MTFSTIWSNIIYSLQSSALGCTDIGIRKSKVCGKNSFPFRGKSETETVYFFISFEFGTWIRIQGAKCVFGLVRIGLDCKHRFLQKYLLKRLLFFFLIEKKCFFFISVILWTLNKRKLIHPQPGKISIFVTSENKYILKYIEHRIRFHLFVVNIVLCIWIL